jgi:predicted GTPase
MKNNLFKKIKIIPCESKSNSIYSKRIKFINKNYLIYKLIRDYHIFNYINNKDIRLQFDLQDLNYEHTINLMMCGRKRAGKSSLVNILLGEEVSYADSGNSITKGIREYKHKKYNLCIFDTVGFDKKGESKELPNQSEDKNENVDTVINEIKKYEEENKIYKKKFIYFYFV